VTDGVFAVAMTLLVIDLRLPENFHIVLIVASVLTIAASLLVPKWAMLVYLVNFVDGPLRWLLKGNTGRSRKA
jgi:uncharacterized membrane protein